MLSSVGSGSVLFTPRVGSRYGYELLWAALVVIVFQWAMIREVGRYTVATGRTILDGYRDIPGPRGWAVWFVFVPQILAAVVTIAGIAALAGSALMIALPGAQWMYAAGLIVISIVLVITGRYKGVERVSAALAGVLMITTVVSAVAVFPRPAEFAGGLTPGLPEDIDLYFILPWFGFILAGAAGLMWFSYWVSARGYGGDHAGRGDADLSEEDRIARLNGWFRVMDTTALIGVVGGGLVVLSFLILGAEVLRPEGIVPEGIAVAEDLTRLFVDLWGPVGRWILLVGIFIALSGTILADQDGWGRTFADATRLLVPKAWRDRGPVSGLLEDRERLKNPYAHSDNRGAPADRPDHREGAGPDPVARRDRRGGAHAGDRLPHLVSQSTAIAARAVAAPLHVRRRRRRRSVLFRVCVRLFRGSSRLAASRSRRP